MSMWVLRSPCENCILYGVNTALLDNEAYPAAKVGTLRVRAHYPPELACDL